MVTTTDTWLVHRLCGAFVTDASTASRSLLTRPGLDRHGTTSWSACSAWPARRCPRSSTATRSSAAQTFSGRRCPVAGLIVDQQAALLAESCLDAGRAKCTFGTGAFLLAQLGANAGPVHVGPDHLGGVAAARAHVVLRRRAGLHRGLRGALGRRPRPGARRRPARRLSQPTPATACCACPRWPGWPRRGGTRAATASFTGMTLSSGRGQLVRALLEGIAAQVAALAELVAADLGQPLTRLRVDGGLTRSAVLMQAQADLARIPVDVYPSLHATAARRRRVRPAGARPEPRRDGRRRQLDTRRTPTSRSGPPTAPPSTWRDGCAPRNRLSRRRGQPAMSGSLDISDVVVIGAGIVGSRDRPRTRGHRTCR